MQPNYTYKLLHSKGNHWKEEEKKTTHRMGDLQRDQQGVTLQNRQKSHTVLYKKPMQLKNGQKI